VLATVLAVTLGLAGGAQGRVVIDPAQPVCMLGQPCTAPDAGEVLAFWRGSHRVASTRTDAGGRFRLSLGPGLYRVTLPHRRSRVALAPQLIRVPQAGYARLTLRVDIGIR
jgi:hypothetical protein